MPIVLSKHFVFFSIALFVISFSAKAQRDSTQRKIKIQLLPVLTHSVETGWATGALLSSTFRLKADDTLTRTSNVQALLLYSFRKQFVSAINGAAYFPSEKYIANYQFSFSHFPDKFWGLGNNSPDSAEESYTFEQAYAYLHLLRNIGNNFFVGALYEYQNLIKVDFLQGGLFDKQDVAGRYGYVISGLGASFTFDNRNNAFSPDKGGFFQFYFNHFDHAFGSDYYYTNYVIDVRKFWKICYNDILALQFYSFSNTGNEIPLRSLASLGGAYKMRGYYEGRYRDKNQMIIQAEDRVHIAGRFGAVAFAGLGDVAHTPFDYKLNELKYSFGAGLRFALNKKEKLNLRLDYGFSKGGNSGFYFQLGEAF
jgi:hypothetical protein